MNFKSKNIVVIGCDPAFRKSGFVISICDFRTRKLTFNVFSSFFEFLKWGALFRNRMMTESCQVIVGVENSNLKKTTFARSRKGSIPEMLSKSRDIGKNMAASQYTVDALRLFFGKHVYEFVPKKFGRWATGGKKPHIQFQGLVKTYGLKVEGYKPPKKRNSITTTQDQDMRDAFFVGDLGLRRHNQEVKIRH